MENNELKFINKIESTDSTESTEPIIPENNDNNIEKEKIKGIIVNTLKISNENSDELIDSLLSLNTENINGIMYDIKSKGINFNTKDIKHLKNQPREILQELLAINSLSEEDYVKYKKKRWSDIQIKKVA